MSLLDRLILEQSADAAGLLAHTDVQREKTFTDANFRERMAVRNSTRLERFHDRDADHGYLIHEGAQVFWAGPTTPCPICRGNKLKPREYCLRCDRCGADGTRTFPGLGVDEAPDPEWSGTPTSYRPAILRGGKR